MKLTTGEFIEKAKAVHGDKYDYSDCVYENARTKMPIKCPDHGVFMQNSNAHTRGTGCPGCSGNKRGVDAFMERVKSTHGDKYDYSKVVYTNSEAKITIICSTHGEFNQQANAHVRGQGCPKCSAERLGRSQTLTTGEFIEKAKSTHGDKYDYSKAKYVKAIRKVVITCPDHGEFKQQPNNHLTGAGCPKCASNARRSTTSEFIEKAKAVHGDKYDYSKVVHTNTYTKVTITCSEHGDFEQQPKSHLNGNGCLKCASNARGIVRRLTTSEFIEKAKSVHGDRYDYSKVNYANNRTKTTITCSEHGEFEQLASNHLTGAGCPKCSAERLGRSQRLTTGEFIEKAKAVHGDKYDYSKAEYLDNNRTKITIICSTHGEFEQRPNDHLSGSGCPKCTNSGPSEPEQMIFELCQSYAPDVQQSNRTAIAPLELDIYIPSLKLAIEYNGNFWHSEQFKPKNYHQEKFLKCQEAGIQLFQIWEQDWLNPVKQEIILSMLQYKLGHNRRVYARKTKCHEITYKMAKAFYNEHHLQGAGMCHSKQTHWGLFEGTTPVMMMSVDLRNNYIIRVATAKGLAVVGGASKLFKMLPTGDYMSYGANDLGATLKHYPNAKRSMTEPRYYWWKNGEKVQRQAVQKHKLPKRFPDYDGSSERVWMESLGYYRVFDSGNTKLEFTI